MTSWNAWVKNVFLRSRSTTQFFHVDSMSHMQLTYTACYCVFTLKVQIFFAYVIASYKNVFKPVGLLHLFNSTTWKMFSINTIYDSFLLFFFHVFFHDHLVFSYINGPRTPAWQGFFSVSDKFLNKQKKLISTICKYG